jgi:hypothetical protein
MERQATPAALHLLRGSALTSRQSHSTTADTSAAVVSRRDAWLDTTEVPSRRLAQSHDLAIFVPILGAIVIITVVVLLRAFCHCRTQREEVLFVPSCALMKVVS